ncbi:hypothetical protein [Lacticaseibacillus parakribbianus]|uniref:hypothetical protein n=1 Tax=Lacticaseibacillus parakribbianus TaxID=2970927 RepID=UPI0021CB90DA|nr:hypothetical protein [Lacticaseibacillus parakribbianus]
MSDLPTGYPLVDAQGRPLKLQPKVTYTLRVKNGYILGLRQDQRQVRLPNLLRDFPNTDPSKSHHR